MLIPNPIKYLRSAQYRAEYRKRRAQAKLIKRQKVILTELAHQYAKIIPRALREMGVVKVYKNKEGQITEVMVRIYKIEISADYFIFWIAHPYPIGVNWRDMAKEIEHVSDRCKAPASVKYQPREGLRFLIERRGSVGGVPKHVSYKQALGRLAEDTRKNALLTFPAGIGEDDKFCTMDLVELPHLVVSGATGYGKSNGLAALLCSLAETYSPRDLEFIFIDYKNSDLFMMEGIPQLGLKRPLVPLPEEIDTSEAISSLEQSMQVFRWVMKESEARTNQRIKPSRSRNLRGYNIKNRSSALPYIVIVIDELSLLMLHPDYKKDAASILGMIAGTVRSAGIHLILCTQYPKSEVLPGLINANVPGRITFYCTTGPASGVALGDGTHDAFQLIDAQRGRALLIGQKYQKQLVQVPRITDRDITQAVERAAKKWAETPHDITATDLLSWAYLYNEGFYDWRRLHNEFEQQGISAREIKKVGSQYQVKEQAPGQYGPTFKLDLPDEHPDKDIEFILAPPFNRADGGYHRQIRPVAIWEKSQAEAETAAPEALPEPEEDEIDPAEIFAYALAEFGGEVSVRKLSDALDISRRQMLNLYEEFRDGTPIEINGESYTLEIGQGVPSKLKKLGVTVTVTAPEPRKHAKSGPQGTSYAPNQANGKTKSTENENLTRPARALKGDIVKGEFAE